MFTVLTSRPLSITSTTSPKAFLIKDDWDDWFEFSTLFHLIIFDEANIKHELGSVKIGQFGLSRTGRSPQIPEKFDGLDERFFSLGQSDNYIYEANAPERLTTRSGFKWA